MVFRRYFSMFEEIYIEALLVDEDAADQVWEAWDKGEIEEMTAFLAWWTIAASIYTIQCVGP